MTDAPPLPRSTPEAQGIPSAALLAFINAAEQHGFELHSLMLVRHGHVVAEGWWQPYGLDVPQHLYSLSKSFTATAIGLAVRESRLTVEDSVVSFFPDDMPADVSANLAAMRVHHLLSMATGHATDTLQALRQQAESNWVRGFLAAPVVHSPGTHFVYNSGATYMLSAILQRLTGMTLLDYLRPRLLTPLGILQASWQSDPRGINVGGWGLSLTTEAIARFGQLYLQHGTWSGRQLVPADWVATATTAQVANGSDPESDWSQGYGYQFWRCRHNAYRGDGAFGQFCVVLPEQDAVLVLTSAVGDMQAELNLVWEHLLPAMGGNPLPENPESYQELGATLKSRAYAPPRGQANSRTAAKISGQTFSFEPHALELKTISWDFDDERSILRITDNRGAHEATCGHGSWWRGQTTIDPDGQQAVAAAGAWTSDDTYVATLRFYETPHSLQLTCQFESERLLLDVGFNVSFGPTSFPQLVGTLKR